MVSARTHRAAAAVPRGILERRAVARGAVWSERAAFFCGRVLPAAFGWTGFALGAAGLANRRALPAAAFALSVIALLVPLQIPYARYASPLLPPHLRAPVPTLAGSSRPWGELVGKGATG